MDETPIWERSKENTAPLERGRNVQALEKSFMAHSEDERHKNEDQLRQYESMVRPTESSSFQLAHTNDDPLLHWLSYIKFYQDTYPSDTHAQFLLFERCMRSLYRIDKYANDTRFVRICCRYAGQTERSSEVFQHLYQQKIGSELAMFWIAWSFVCEKQGDYQFAKKILEKGIRKEAKPLNKLESRFQQFQRRMASHWLNATQNGEDDLEDEENGQPSRGVLVALSEDAVRRNDRRQRRGQHSTRPLFSQATLADTTNTHPNENRSRNEVRGENSSQNFAIFVDDSENRPDQSLLLNESTMYPLDRPIEREEDRKKENTMERQRWNERGGYEAAYDAQRARSRPVAQPLPPFAIHVDDECAAKHARDEEEALRSKIEMRGHRDERTFRERERAGMVEKLQEDPLLYIRDPSRFQEDQEAEVKEKRSNDDRGMKNDPKANPKKEGRKTKRRATGYQQKLLKNSLGEEQSFEEARAIANYFTLVDASANFNHLFPTCQSPSIDDSSMMIDQSDTSIVEIHSKRPSNLNVEDINNDDPNSRNQFSIPTPTPRNQSTASSTVDEAAGVGLSEERIEQTINTQMAIRELSMMFSSPALEAGSKKAAKRSGGLGHILNVSGVSHGDPMPSIIERPDDNGTENPTFDILDELAANAVDSSFARVPGSPPPNKPCTSKQQGASCASSFTIFNDGEENKDTCPDSQSNKSQFTCTTRNKTVVEPSFSIFNDDQDVVEPCGVQPCSVSQRKKRPIPTMSFSIYNDKKNMANDSGEPSAPMESIIKEQEEQSRNGESTEPLSTRRESVESTVELQLSTDNGEPSRPSETSGGDTATFSLFDDDLKDLDGETASLGSLVDELNGIEST